MCEEKASSTGLWVMGTELRRGSCCEALFNRISSRRRAMSASCCASTASSWSRVESAKPCVILLATARVFRTGQGGKLCVAEDLLERKSEATQARRSAVRAASRLGTSWDKCLSGVVLLALLEGCSMLAKRGERGSAGGRSSRNTFLEQTEQDGSDTKAVEWFRGELGLNKSESEDQPAIALCNDLRLEEV